MAFLQKTIKVAKRWPSGSRCIGYRKFVPGVAYLRESMSHFIDLSASSLTPEATSPMLPRPYLGAQPPTGCRCGVPRADSLRTPSATMLPVRTYFTPSALRGGSAYAARVSRTRSVVGISRGTQSICRSRSPIAEHHRAHTPAFLIMRPEDVAQERLGRQGSVVSRGPSHVVPDRKGPLP